VLGCLRVTVARIPMVHTVLPLARRFVSPGPLSSPLPSPPASLAPCPLGWRPPAPGAVCVRGGSGAVLRPGPSVRAHVLVRVILEAIPGRDILDDPDPLTHGACLNCLTVPVRAGDPCKTRARGGLSSFRHRPYRVRQGDSADHPPIPPGSCHQAVVLPLGCARGRLPAPCGPTPSRATRRATHPSTRRIEPPW
jgi:hypothetical protein